MTRIAALLKALDWPHKRLATHLGVDRSVVTKMVGGQGESGPVRRLLDLLAAQHDLPHLASDVWSPDQGDPAVAPPASPPAAGGAA